MSANQESRNPLCKLSLEWMSAGIANALSSAVLNPMDVAKTRMQAMQLHQTTDKSISLLRTFSILYRESGLVGLWKPGLNASMAREMLYSGPRAGFYVPVRNYLHQQLKENDDDIDTLSSKIGAALVTGTLGAVIANPVDVVKIRLMVEPKLYPSLSRGISSIFHEEGLVGLYKGLLPSTIRGAFIAVGELATYDQSKSFIKRNFDGTEGFQLHVICSLITGIVATSVAAPFDLLKTRAMNSKTSSKSIVNILSTSIQEEGLSILFRGWVPAYLRLGPHALICFPIFEQIRKLFGLDYI